LQFVDPDTDLCTARLWERCFTLKGLQILTETFRLHELMTHEVASLVVAPLTANASTNFVNAFVDGTLDTDWMPEGTLKQMSYHEVRPLQPHHSRELLRPSTGEATSQPTCA
jgi:hypothetical protein